MHEIGPRPSKSALALAFGLFTTAALCAGCGRSSGVIDGELDDSARKAVFAKRVDVKNASSSRPHSKSLGSPGGARRP